MSKEQEPPEHHSFTHADEVTLEGEGQVSFGGGIRQRFSRLKSPVGWLLIVFLTAALLIGRYYDRNWIVEKVSLEMLTDDKGYYYTFKGKKQHVDAPIAIADSTIYKAVAAEKEPKLKKEFVFEVDPDTKEKVFSQLNAKYHMGIWSLLPALVAIALCWLLKEPLVALFSGVVTGAFMLQQYDIINERIIETMKQDNTASVLVLYLILLGGLLGIWSRSGAAQAFAEYVTKHFVKGPRSAKLVAWGLGILFFQGGTISTVLVGTTVRPIADKEKISHEELSYIVDSTASPIASLLAFNAWPGYIQSFLFVSGVGFLATEADRLKFFFASVPFSFYAIFAVLGTFLLSIDKAPYLGKRMRDAIKRSRETGELDAPGATPLSAKELSASDIPEGYKPHLMEFVLPLVLLIGIAIVTFIQSGSPEVEIAFGVAVLTAALMALFKGMTVQDLMFGFGEGLKGSVLGAMILVLAIGIGGVSKEIGGGVYLVESLGTGIPYWSMPLILLVMTMTIAFSTGTSWGTYAVTFPLAMPLAWSIASAQGLANPEIYMSICFATVLNGSVIGDQCSPISDTTILSSMCTGCDLMDHVRTQIPPAAFAASLAAVCWVIATLLLA